MFATLRLSVLVFLISVMTLSSAWSATRYVIDRIVVSMRDSPKSGANVISYLKSDQAVELLEDGDPFARVKTEDGEVGYVQKQYLTDALPKPETIRRLEQQNERLTTQLEKMKQEASMSTSQVEQDRQRLTNELDTARGKIESLELELVSSQTAQRELDKAYQALRKNSENVVAISDERDRLQKDNDELKQHVATLSQERDDLLKGGAIKWFFAGSAVLLIGWIIGKMSGSRRRSSLL